MNIIKINKNNISYLQKFLENKLPTSFRYFNKRSIDVINNHYSTLIGLLDETPVAYGHIDQDIENNIYWLGICVLEPYQNKKYGTQILEKLLDEFHRSNLEKLYLSVDKDNIIGQKLYTKYGFTIQSEEETYLKMVLNNNLLYLPVSYGEAIDKLTILDIKLQKLRDQRKEEVKKEYDKLYYYLQKYLTKCQFYYNMLKEVNLSIWEKQDLFRYSSEETSKNKLCIEIIEENDMRFRIKNKINILLNSFLKEQKGYKIKKAFVLSHLGLGDNITTVPIARYLSTMYDEVIIVCKSMHYENIKLFYEDDPTIKILEVPDDNCICPLLNKDNFEEKSKDCDLFLMGIHNSKNITLYSQAAYFHPITVPFNFYEDINLDYSIFWKYFYVPTTPESEELYKILEKNNIKDYLFVHNIASNGKIFEYCDNRDSFIINPCVNHYDPDHKYYLIAENFINKKLIAYTQIMINASEVHLTDSSFFCLALGLEIKTDKCYIYPRNDRDYNYLWSEKYKYTAATNKRIFINKSI